MLKKWTLIFLLLAVFVGTSSAITQEECIAQMFPYSQNCLGSCYSANPINPTDDYQRIQQIAEYCGTKCTDEAFNWVIAQHPECSIGGSTQQSDDQPAQQTPQQSPQQQTQQQTPQKKPKQKEECENLYSDCILQSCTSLIGLGKSAEALAQLCLKECQRQVEAKRGADCVLLPGKATPWFGTGKVEGVEGDVFYITPTGEFYDLKNINTIPLGSRVFSTNGKAKITFEDGSVIEIQPHTFLNYISDGYRLSAGRMRNFIRCSLNQMGPGSFACPSISTPVGNFRVKGTDFILEHFPPPFGDYTVLYVKEGQVEAVSTITGESQIANAGEKLFINMFVDREGSVDKETFSEDDWDEMMEEIQIRDSAPFSFLAIGCWLVGIGVVAYVIWRLVRKLKNRASGSSDAKVNKKGFRKEDNTCKCGNKITKSDTFCPQCGRKIR